MDGKRSLHRLDEDRLTMVTECRHWRLFLIGLITRSHSILSFGIEPGFIPYHNIALIGTLSPSTILFLVALPH
jgi:hypothetical protein